MSLLMKALEKAAKDRSEARSEPAVAPAAVAPAAVAKSELSLEPIPTGAPAAPAPRPETAIRPAAAPLRTGSPLPAAAPAAAPARDPAQAQAGRVTQAQAVSRPAFGIAIAYLHAHPIVVFGALAGVAAIGFGIYVYLQISHPGLFRPAPKAPVQPLVQAPAAPVRTTVTPPAGLIPSAPLLKEAAGAAPAAAGAVRARPQPAARATTPDEAPRSTVSVSQSSPELVLNPLHAQAYAALQAGRAEEAQSLYGQLLGAEPKNVDALLGLAAIAAQQGNSDEAVRRYLQILELEPRHALAQSGLIALLGRADPLAAESKLRQLIAREPSAHLYFTLGNLYADQSQWSAAQQSYFQAHHLEPANPDYAYNLAVALEHVNQSKLALGFYRRAVQLAATRGRVNFNLPQAQQRVAKLAAQVE